MIASARQAAASGLRFFKDKLSVPDLLLGLAWLLCLAVGPLNNYARYLAFAMAFLLLAMWRYEEFYVLIAVFLFFMEQFYLKSLTPVFRMYSYLCLLKFVIELPQAKIRTFYLPTLAVFILFSLFGVGRVSLRFAFNIIADVLLAYCALVRLSQKPELMRKFFTMLVLVGVAAGIYSLSVRNVIEYEIGRQNVRSEGIVRYCATFADANYAGFYYIACVFACLNVKTMKKWRIPLLLALAYFILLTNSITTLLTLAVCSAAYIVLRYPRQAPWIFAILLVVAAVGISVVLSVPALYNIDFIHNVILRVSEQLRYFRSGRMDMFTSDRTYIWKYFFDIFRNEDILGKLFGGNVVTAMVVDEVFVDYKACHQAYLQGMMNFGLIGALVVFLTIIVRDSYRALHYWFKERYTESADLVRTILILAVNWLVFGFSIDFFLDWRFMFFYFL